VLVYAIFALAFDFIFGGLGLLSLGHAAFFGVGAYGIGILTLRYGLPWFPALLLSCCAGAALAAAFSAIALRLQGIFFALVTLALSELVYNLALTKLKPLTGGFDGMPGVLRPSVPGIDLADDARYFQFVAVVFLLTLAGIAFVRRSEFGRAMEAIRQNPVRAEQIGLSLSPIKVTAFALSGFVAALSGALLASLLWFVDPEVLHWTTSGRVVIMTVLGGTGVLVGPVVGVVVFESLREVLSSYTSSWQGLLGAIFVVATIIAPGGVAGLVRQAAARLRRSP